MDTTWYTSPYIPMHHYPWCSGLRSRPCRISCRQKYLFLPYSHTLFRQKYHFSFDRSNMQIFTLNITRVVWPHVTNLLDLRYFCRHNPLFYHLNLIPWHYWGWQKNIYFLVNIFVRHTFFMSKSSIKTKTVLTMTNETEPTELLAFKRKKDGYKVTVNIFLCNCVVLWWDELKVRQNLLASDCEIYMVCLLVATFHWHIKA